MSSTMKELYRLTNNLAGKTTRSGTGRLAIAFSLPHLRQVFSDFFLLLLSSSSSFFFGGGRGAIRDSVNRLFTPLPPPFAQSYWASP